MYPIRKHVIESILPERSITIVSGSSGSGKTILTMQAVEEWYSSSTFLGFSARPNPKIAYYTYDRSQEDAWDTLNSLGVYLPQMAIYCGISGGKSSYPTKAIFKQSDCVIIDGIDFLTDNPNDVGQVKTAFHAVMGLMEETTCSTIGITGSNKSKIGEGYLNSRDRSYGSSAWARLSGTNINIVLDEDALISSRTVHITPRNSGKIRIEMDFNDKGRLVPANSSSEDDALTKFYKLLPNDFSTGEAIDIGVRGLKVSQVTVKRYLNLLLGDLRISKIEHGHYKKLLTLVTPSTASNS